MLHTVLLTTITIWIKPIKRQLWTLKNGKKAIKSLHKITLQGETQSCNRSWVFVRTWTTHCTPGMFATYLTNCRILGTVIFVTEPDPTG